MGRPRRGDIPEERRHCVLHGMSTWRRYRNGQKAGVQQYAWFCLPCRAEVNLDRYHNQTKEVSA